MLYPYSFADRKRDLAEVFKTVIKEEPRFISNFRRAADATSRRHEYFEDEITGRSIDAVSISRGVLTVFHSDVNKVTVGTTLRKKDDPALFVVTDISGTQIAVALAAANGSDLTAYTLPDRGTFDIVSRPVYDAVVDAPIVSDAWNAAQIFRKEIVLSGSALAVNLFGSADNQLNRQTAFALSDLARDLNLVALFGRRVEAAKNVRGEAGGLYFFAAAEGASIIDADGGNLDQTLIRDAAEIISGEGGEPAQILCSPMLAYGIAQEFRDRFHIIRSDERRGAYVAKIENDFDAFSVTVIADPDVPSSDAWVLDPACFALANLSGREISDIDDTPKGFDGIRRIATGELTFEFRNVRQRCCRIKNLTPVCFAQKGAQK